MDVARLRVLREFADRGTVGATAAALSLTPSAVSHQLKQLAREAGVALLEPDGRRVRLTDAGRALVLRADDVVAALERADAEMEAYRGSPRGRVSVGMFPSAAVLLLPTVLRHATRLGIDFAATDVDMTPPEVPGLLADHDVVLAHRDERAPGLGNPRVHVETVLREPIDLLVAPDHRFADRGSVALDDLTDEDWISVRGGFPVDDVLRSIALVTGVNPRVTLQFNDFRVIEELVVAGYGVALMPRFAAMGAAVPLRLDGVRAARLFEVALRPGARRRPAVAAALSALTAAIAELFGPDPMAPVAQVPGVRRDA